MLIKIDVIVSAFATEQGISLGQLAVDGKSNEITAVLELLKKLSLHGNIITLDAMGCQRSIAQNIIWPAGKLCPGPKRQSGKKTQSRGGVL
ncbi:ISAs1 family transposase [Pantoea agglomerans]|uniref:ISAs1 family transposase n=1 Tax=Enterobacter agglomerans TaxID=549 RepID=UPI0024136362|nr:ISAs1 family transposase [Pantoea agglomerans]